MGLGAIAGASFPPPAATADTLRGIPSAQVGTAWSSAPQADGGTRLFFFFSNRLGCLGSLALSLAVTAVLVLLLWR